MAGSTNSSTGSVATTAKMPSQGRKRTAIAGRLVKVTICTSILLSACAYGPGQVGAVLLDGHAQPLVDRQHSPRALTTTMLDGNGLQDIWKRQSNNTAGNGGGGVTVSIPGAGGDDESSTTSTSSSSTTSTTSTTTSAPTSDTTTSDTAITTSDTTTSTSSSSSTSETNPTTSDTTTAQTTDSSLTSGLVQTTVVTTTLDNGSVLTTPVPTTSSGSQNDDNNNKGDEGSNSKAWIIPLSVVAGVVALAGILFIGYRFSQRRFSELDDDDGNGIRWPELMQRHGEESTTLNPLATKRREGAGFDMDEGKNVSQLSLAGGGTGMMDGVSSINGRLTPSNTEIFAAAGLGAPAMAIARSNSSQGSSQHGANSGAYYQGPNNGYYDPYLGASGAPYPPPPRVVSPNQGYYDPYQDNPDYTPASPYYPPPARSNVGTSGRSSPFQGQGPAAGGSPVVTRAATPPVGLARSNSIPLDQAYAPPAHGGNNTAHGGEYEDVHHPDLDPPLSPSISVPPQLAPVRAASPPQLPAPPTVRPMRLSIANPDDLVDDGR